LTNISKSIGVIGEGTTKRMRENQKSLREMVSKPRATNSPTNYYVDANGANKQKKEEENYWREQAERYERAYDKVLSIFKEQDPLINDA